MVWDFDAVSTGALEDIAYLSRSANRITILDALTRGRYPRRELAELTGVSRTTLDRIVNELEERGWAQRTSDGEYGASPRGDHLMAEMRPFIESVEAVNRLDETVAYLPVEDMSIGLHHFSDAVVRRPKRDDPMEMMDYIIELIQDTTEFHVLTHFTPPSPVTRTMRDCILDDDLTAEYILTDGVLDYLRSQPDRRNRWRDILVGGADMFHKPGPIPCNLWILDEVVLIKKSSPDSIQDIYGVPIESKNETVRSWAQDLIETCRTEANRVTTRAFAEEPSPL